MKKHLCLLVLLTLSFSVFADTTNTTPLVRQTIVYKTSKASEVYLVWTMDNWKIPDGKYQPVGTYITKGMAYTKMNGNKDSFYLTLQLPKGIYIDYMLWASKDVKGDSLQGWDTNWGGDYNVYIDGKDTIKMMTDEKLGIAEKIKQQEKPFNLLENGWIIFIVGLLIALLAAVIRFAKRKKGTWTSGNHFIGALLIASFLIMVVTRLQLNNHLSHALYLIPGLAYYDFALVLFLAATSFLLLYFSRGLPVIRYFFLFVLGSIIFSAALASVLNIEVVRQLGKPLTYNWLYYSDFLQGSDAKNAIKAGFTPMLIKNLQLIASGVLLAAFGFSIISNLIFKKLKQTVVTAASFASGFFILSFIQLKQNKFEQDKVENPIASITLSWLNAGKRSQLFTMKVSDDAKKKIEEMHTSRNEKKLPLSDSITNVLVFVLESTPASLVQVYDSTYKVTPNLNKWKRHARIYNNMYAHLPTTPNTMLSIVSGIYPLISYKSLVNEYPGIKIQSLPATLKQNGWKTSLFFSSDLIFSNMGNYLKAQQVETAEDFKSIECGYEKFNSGYAQLDGLNDRCIVSRYFDWRKGVPITKSFSILWTNQTHYPYFSSGDEKKFTANKELNKYLNALEEVDNAFGELMDGLEKSQGLNNTIVIVTGDHGEAFGTHNQYTHGGNIYEENMRVPFLLINPKLFHGETDNRIGGVVDIAPTITHLLGLNGAKEWEGTSLLSNYKRDHAFFLGPYSDFQFGSRFQNWKLIYNAANSQFNLFDIVKDPGELNDVSKKNRKIIKDEYELMAGWVQYHNNKLTPFLK